MPPHISFLALLLIFFFIFIFWQINTDKHKEFVQSYSTTLKKLSELNTLYHFFDNVSFDMSYTYDNEHFFDLINCQDYLIYQLQFKQRKIIEQIKKIKQNEINYNKYLNKLKELPPIGTYSVPYGNLKKQKLIEIESKLYNKMLLTPCISFRIAVSLYRSSMDGMIYDKKIEYFNADTILFLINRLNNKNGTYFNDKEIWDSVSIVERGKVSNRMRFSIYERDGYRCRNCGISEKYAKLEIDHIIPIAKGGKTEYNNLQTLCHKCNVEKSDSLPYRNSW